MPQTKQQYLFAKANHPLADTGKHNTTAKSPFTYDTPTQPKMSSNIKRVSQSYSRGNVPANHQGLKFSKESIKKRADNYKMESAMRIAKNKKFSENKSNQEVKFEYRQHVQK